MDYKPLSDLQRAVYRNAPTDWTVLERSAKASGTRATIDVLHSRGLIEKRAGINCIMWRKKPATLEQAVRRLVDCLPQSERAMAVYHAAEELQEVRALLDQREAATRGQGELAYTHEALHGHVQGGLGFAA